MNMLTHDFWCLQSESDIPLPLTFKANKSAMQSKMNLTQYSPPKPVDTNFEGKSFFGCRFKEHHAPSKPSQPDDHQQIEETEEGDKPKTKVDGQKGCPVCKAQIKDGERFITRYVRKQHLYTQQEPKPVYTFFRLVRDLSQDLDS